MQHKKWQKVLQGTNTSPEYLLNNLNIEDSTLGSRQANIDFPLRVPAGFINRMNLNNPDDPLL